MRVGRHEVTISNPEKPFFPERGLTKGDLVGYYLDVAPCTLNHIRRPIKPELPYPEVRRFAKAVAQEVERRVDDQRVATTTWKVADREGVFVDYGQNARDRTIAAAYSIRPTPDARASVPLGWDEVPGADPAALTLEAMRERIAKIGDPTAGMWRRKVALASRFEMLGLAPADPAAFDDSSWPTKPR